MKKTLTLMVAMCMTVAANAKILRVSNLEGNSAPYSSISEALNAATNGDTIMVDGSNNSYGSLKRSDNPEENHPVVRKVVILGPGYWLTENGKTDIGAASAIVEDIDICADGVEICGMYINGKLTIASNKVVVNRCHIQWGIGIEKKLEDIIIHQNAISGGISGELYNNSNGIFPPVVTINNVQVTNNIFMNDPTGSGRYGTVANFNQSVIANNTWAEWTSICLSQIYNSTVKDNIFNERLERCDGSTFTNNQDGGFNVAEVEKDIKTDLDVQKRTAGLTVGAYTGNDPYVVSGIPTGTVIEDLSIPASVREGEKLNITIKLGVSR